MGKGTDKLYVTQTEWTTGGYSANNLKSSKNSSQTSFKRLPFNYCAVSLQPFEHPVCTADGTTFDLIHILSWLKKHGTNPVDGTPLKGSELIKLHFAKNDNGDYIDPVSYKPLTDNSHVVALRNTGNVFTWETIERLNIKAKSWNDLVNEEPFTRKDIITLQDPTNLASRDLSSFKYIKDGTSTLTEEEERERADPTSNLNLSAMGSSAKILKAKEAVAKARAERAAASNPNHSLASTGKNPTTTATKSNTLKTRPANAALHTTGQAAASFTSTGFTPVTSGERAILSDEEMLLKPRQIKQKGYARISTTHGSFTIELNTEYAPRTVWNFVQLAKKGYYRSVPFHRNIRNFMIQGGDPTGTGRGGTSCWGTPFVDEYAQSPLKHDSRGVLSMANKGKNSNTSQFFVLYKAAPHLNNKHTIFGRLVDTDGSGEGEATLDRLEAVETGEGNRPVEECSMLDVVVYVDPFEEFLKSKDAGEKKKQNNKSGNDADAEETVENDDDLTTWTGKRIRKDGTITQPETAGVGKYFDAANTNEPEEEILEVVEEWQEEPPAKKRKAGGFGNFDGW